MSLLLDALKKAAEEKQKAQANREEAAADDDLFDALPLDSDDDELNASLLLDDELGSNITIIESSDDELDVFEETLLEKSIDVLDENQKPAPVSPVTTSPLAAPTDSLSTEADDTTRVEPTAPPLALTTADPETISTPPELQEPHKPQDHDELSSAADSALETTTGDHNTSGYDNTTTDTKREHPVEETAASPNAHQPIVDQSPPNTPAQATAQTQTATQSEFNTKTVDVLLKYHNRSRRIRQLWISIAIIAIGHLMVAAYFYFEPLLHPNALGTPQVATTSPNGAVLPSVTNLNDRADNVANQKIKPQDQTTQTQVSQTQVSQTQSPQLKALQSADTQAIKPDEPATSASAPSDKSSEPNPSPASQQGQQATSNPPDIKKAAHQVHPATGIERSHQKKPFIRRNAPNLAVHNWLNKAYQAYTRGDIEAASTYYLRVLNKNPRQRDALLGAAAIAIIENKPDRALHYYKTILTDHPLDHLARAGIISLTESNGNTKLESELKILIHEQPEISHLHFALGNVYSEQRRWNEAQKAYFEAWSRNSSNPDYNYNLAVALDHLGQEKTALEFYKKSRALGEHAPHRFSDTALSDRIAALTAITNSQIPE